MAAKFVYTLSSKRRMVTEAVHSIRTLTDYVSPSDVVVFYTPPRKENDIQTLRDHGVDLRLVDAETDASSAFRSSSHYGELVKLCTLDADTVVALACDTLIFDDLREVMAGEFDVKARPSPSSVQQPAWREMFERFDRPTMSWMPDTGFLVFKNGVHRELRDQWLRFLTTNLGYSHGGGHEEAYSLALAAAEYEVARMDEREHAIEWNNERPSDGVVHQLGHRYQGSPYSEIVDDIEFRIRAAIRRIV